MKMAKRDGARCEQGDEIVISIQYVGTLKLLFVGTREAVSASMVSIFVKKDAGFAAAPYQQ
jgi:hypothetical protein